MLFFARKKRNVFFTFFRKNSSGFKKLIRRKGSLNRRRFFFLKKRFAVRTFFKVNRSIVFLKIFQSGHNFFVNVTSFRREGNKNLFTYSCGMLGLKGSKKVTTRSLYNLGSKIGFFLRKRGHFNIAIALRCSLN